MLVDLETARRNLHQLDTSDDDNIVTLLRGASAAVLNHLKVPASTYEDSEGNPLNVPWEIKAAVLLAMQSLYDNPEADPMTAAVRSILLPLRDPALA